VADESTTELHGLRREVAALEARRDELAARLAVLREDDEASEPADKKGDASKPAKKKRVKAKAQAPPEPMEWRPRNWKGAFILLSVFGVFLFVFNDKIAMWLVAGGVSTFVVCMMIWPPRLSMHERGMSVRSIITTYEYSWTELSDFRVSTASHQVEVKTKHGWQAHAYAAPSEEERLEADACARAWIQFTRAAAADEGDGKRRKKRRKRKKRRRRAADGLPG